MNREQLNKLHELVGEINNRKETASELLRIAQDRFGDKKHKVKRGTEYVRTLTDKLLGRPGHSIVREVEIREKTLWEEVWHLGTTSDAGKILSKEHPEVFEAYQKEAAAAVELERFCLAEFGFNFRAMTLSDYLAMTEKMFTLLMSERTPAKGVE